MQFEFFAPEEKDFLGLKALLAPYLNGQEFESSALIDAIIAEARSSSCCLPACLPAPGLQHPDAAGGRSLAACTEGARTRCRRGAHLSTWSL